MIEMDNKKETTYQFSGHQGEPENPNPKTPQLDWEGIQGSDLMVLLQFFFDFLRVASEKKGGLRDV